MANIGGAVKHPKATSWPAVSLDVGTDWDRVGIDWDVAAGLRVGTDWDEVGTDWYGERSPKCRPRKPTPGFLGAP